MDLPLTVSIRSITAEAPGILAFDLRPLNGGKLPRFSAGSHIELALPGGLRRHYSLLNDPAEDHRYVIAVHQSPQSRGGSRWLHQTPRVGEPINIGMPRNNFALDEQAPHSILIAGGIGITPLLSMAHRLETLGRSWQLHQAVRSRSLAGFGDTLARWSGRVKLHADDEQGGRLLDIAMLVAAAPSGSHFYCCGPAPMLAAFEQATADLPPDHVHLEHFQAKAAPLIEATGAFEIELRRSGISLQVPAQRSMLDVLLDAGIDAPYSCGEGFCGSCRTAVSDGRPHHLDSVLTPADRARNDCVILCCSRSHSARLVLEL